MLPFQVKVKLGVMTIYGWLNTSQSSTTRYSLVSYPWHPFFGGGEILLFHQWYSWHLLSPLLPNDRTKKEKKKEWDWIVLNQIKIYFFLDANIHLSINKLKSQKKIVLIFFHNILKKRHKRMEKKNIIRNYQNAIFSLIEYFNFKILIFCHSPKKKKKKKKKLLKLMLKWIIIIIILSVFSKVCL